MWGYLGNKGKNFRMIMEIDAKDANSPIYQMAALAGDKSFDYYNFCVVDGNALYSNNGMELVERAHIGLVRQRNKILNLANQDFALKSHGKGLYVYNYAGKSTDLEKRVGWNSLFSRDGFVASCCYSSYKRGLSFAQYVNRKYQSPCFNGWLEGDRRIYE